MVNGKRVLPLDNPMVIYMFNCWTIVLLNQIYATQTYTHVCRWSIYQCVNCTASLVFYLTFHCYFQDALIGSLLRLIQRMSSSVKKEDTKEDKGLKKALCPALAIPDDPAVRVCYLITSLPAYHLTCSVILRCAWLCAIIVNLLYIDI